MGASEIATLNELFLNAVTTHAKQDCFLSKRQGRYQGMSSQEVLRRVAGMASLLTRLGIQRGDRVAILSENRVEWALTDYALLGLGAIPVPIYTTLLDQDIEYILRDSAAKGIVVATHEQLAKVTSVRPGLPELKFILALDCNNLEGTGADCWEGSLEIELGLTPNAVELFTAKAGEAKPEHTATILYTSGTMGTPKGVVLTHSNIVSNIVVCSKLFPLGLEDAAISLLPLSHILQRVMDFFCFWKGTSIAYAESLEALPQNLREVKPTALAVVPRVLEKIHSRVMEAARKAPPTKKKIFHWALAVGKECVPYQLTGKSLPMALAIRRAVADRLVFSKAREQLGGRLTFIPCGAAPLTAELAAFFHAVGLPVYEGYGLSETSPVIAINYAGHTKLGTVGPVIEGVQVSFGEANPDSEASVGREILVKGPNVTPGYYHLDEENRVAFEGGWFHTGDLGMMDQDGYLRITGRKKNLFKTSGGKYVSPEKLENLFQGNPYVRQIVVLGEGCKFVGALVVPAFEQLEVHAGMKGIEFKTRKDLVSHPDIQAYMQQRVNDVTGHLPPHERILQIVLLPRELSMAENEISATLKVKRRVVELRYRDLIQEMFSRRAPEAEERKPETEGSGAKPV